MEPIFVILFFKGGGEACLEEAGVESFEDGEDAGEEFLESEGGKGGFAGKGASCVECSEEGV